MTYQLQRFLTSSEPLLFDTAIAIRIKVFVEEQNGSPDIEPDDYDTHATQWLLKTESGEAIATGRMFAVKENPKQVKIGRIAVLKEYRGFGIASILMADIVQAAMDVGYDEAILEAQTYATGLYAKYGFIPEGEPFLDEDHIEHILMRKQLKANEGEIE